MRTIDAKLVKERDYIFPFPSLGMGWYVVRCDRGQPENQSFLTFRADPLKNPSAGDSSPAINHFDKTTCPGHEAKNYTAEQIVREFGYRVVGGEVDENWVAKSNQKLPFGRDYAGDIWRF